MANLPGPDAAGPLPDNLPRRMGVGGWNPRVISEDTSQFGRGFEQLGTGASEFAGKMDQQSNEAAEAQATSQFAVGAIKAHQAMGQETDPAAAATYSDVHQKNFENAAAMIPDPRVRAQWEARTAPELARYQSATQDYTQGLVKNQAVAGFDVSTTNGINTAVSTDDDTARQQVLTGINQQLSSLVSRKILSPVEAAQKGQQIAEQFATAQNDRMIAAAQPTYDPVTGAYIPGDTSKLRALQQHYKFGPEAPGWNAQVPGAAPSVATNQSVPPEGRALLDTIAGPESAGRYDVRYTPGGGVPFAGFADHPRIKENGPAGRSDAAGRYQMLSSTWDTETAALGLKDFSPPNQDAASWDLAQKTYAKATNGGDLLTALKSRNPETLSSVATALKGQWPSLPGGSQQGTTTPAFTTGFLSNLQRESSSTTASAAPTAANSYFIGDSIADGLKSAVPGAQGNTLRGRSPAVVQNAIATLDPADLQGKTIYLSSGAANGYDPKSMASIDSQLATLTKPVAQGGKGVDPSNIRLLGVGDRVDFRANGVNDELAAMAAKYPGVTFTGPMDATNLVHQGANTPANSNYGVHYDDWGKGLAQVSGSATGGSPGGAPFVGIPPVGATGPNPHGVPDTSYAYGAPSPSGTGTVMDFLQAQKRAEFGLRINNEINTIERENEAHAKFQSTAALGDLKQRTDDVVQGRVVGPNEFSSIQSAYANSPDPRVASAFKTFGLVRENLQALQGAPGQPVTTQDVRAKIATQEAALAQMRELAPDDVERIDQMETVLKSTNQYLARYESDIKTRPLQRASEQQIIPTGAVQPLDANDKNLSRSIQNRSTAVDLTNQAFGADAPFFLDGEGANFARGLARNPSGLAQITDPNIINRMANDKGFQDATTAMAHSGDPTVMGGAFKIMNAIAKTNPDDFDTKFKGEQSALDLWNDYLVNLDPQTAADWMKSMKDPGFETTKKYRELGADQALKDVKDNDVTKAFSTFSVLNPTTWANGSPKPAVSDEATPMASAGAMRSDYVRAYKEYFTMNPDPNKASDYAVKAISRQWGPSSLNGGLVMRTPPESKYPAISGSTDYLTKQLDDDVKARAGDQGDAALGEGGEDMSKLTPAQIEARNLYAGQRVLISDAQTSRDVSNGELPSYHVIIKDPQGNYDLLRGDDGKAYRFPSAGLRDALAKGNAPQQLAAEADFTAKHAAGVKAQIDSEATAKARQDEINRRLIIPLAPNAQGAP